MEEIRKRQIIRQETHINMNTETDEHRYSKLLAQQIINRSPKILNFTAAANQQCNKARQHANNYVVKTEIKEIKISLGIRFTIRITKNKGLRTQPTRTNCPGHDIKL